MAAVRAGPRAELPTRLASDRGRGDRSTRSRRSRPGRPRSRPCCLALGREPTRARISESATDLRSWSVMSSPVTTPPGTQDDVGVLREVESRVLWLSSAITHHANRVREPLGTQGGRAPGVVGVHGVDHDGALVPAPAAAGPGVGEAAHVARAARDQLPAGRTGFVVPSEAARIRRPAELSEPVKGPGPGRLLDRVRRYRCDRPDLGGVLAALCQRHRRRRGHRAAVLIGRRCRAGRGCGVGASARSRRQ